MSLRQHTPLILTSTDGTSHRLAPVSLQLGRTGGGYDEAWIRDLVFAHPTTLPFNEIEPSFGPLIPVCTELDTRTAGFADALFLNPLGMPTLVECKLWRNPEARREVVGQILDYASVLRRWTFADLQREAARARREQGFDLSAHIQEHGGSADFDEAAFVDNVTRNLAQGRLLLLVVGDGIRAGVETIADYIQGTTGLHFTLGLVEMQAFELGDGRRIVQPRVLTKTLIVNRTVVDFAQPGFTITQDGSADDAAQLENTATISEPTAGERWMFEFWTELLAGLRLDDAEQPLAKPLRYGNIFFSLASKSDTWLTCYFLASKSEIGVFLGSNRSSPVALEIGRLLEVSREDIDKDIGIPTSWSRREEGKLHISASKRYADLRATTEREDQLAWFKTTINGFVNAIRPRVAALTRELTMQTST